MSFYRRSKPQNTILMSWTKPLESLWRHKDFTLQRLSIECILKHEKDFLVHGKDINPFEKLPDALRNEILKLVTGRIYRVDRAQQMLQLLINKRTSSPLKLCFDTDEKNAFLATLISLRPKLKSLTLNVDFSKEEKLGYKTEYEIPIPDHLLRAIVGFVELEDLDLHKAGCLSDDHLEIIAANLKNLRSLQLTFDFGKITLAGIKKLAVLQDLRKINICGYVMQSEATKSEMWHDLLCELPQLQEVNDHEETIRSLYRYSSNLDDKCLDFSLLPETQIQLGLKQIIFCDSEVQIPPNVTMPNLESLILYETSSFFPSSNFNKVSMLCLGFLGRNACNEILGHIGHQLQELNIMEDTDTLYLDEIAKKCPILEEFNLPEGPPELATNFGEMSFAYLKSFVYNDSHNHDGEICMVKFAPSVLLQLLSGAPNLKELSLTHVEFTQMELDAIICELKKGSMLQKLERFSYSALRLRGNEERHNLYMTIRNCFETLAEEMKTHCPCLQRIWGTWSAGTDDDDDEYYYF